MHRFDGGTLDPTEDNPFLGLSSAEQICTMHTRLAVVLTQMQNSGHETKKQTPMLDMGIKDDATWSCPLLSILSTQRYLDKNM